MPDYINEIFGAERQRVQAATQRKKAAYGEALKQKMAMTGGIGSGAYEKQLGGIELELGQQEQEAFGQIAGEESKMRFGEQEAEKQRGFMAGEAEKQRGFSLSEAEKQRGWASAERAGSQDFQRKMFDEELAFKTKSTEWQQKFAEREFDESLKAQNLNAVISLSDVDPDKLQQGAIQAGALGYSTQGIDTSGYSNPQGAQTKPYWWNGLKVYKDSQGNLVRADNNKIIKRA